MSNPLDHYEVTITADFTGSDRYGNPTGGSGTIRIAKQVKVTSVTALAKLMQYLDNLPTTVS